MEGLDSRPCVGDRPRLLLLLLLLSSFRQAAAGQGVAGRERNSSSAR